MTDTQQTKRKSFSACWSDQLGEAIKAASTEPYPAECHYRSEDFESFEHAINQGIDSHLEAVVYTQSVGTCGRCRIVIEPQTVHVLVRRLLESGEDNDASLASSICETLGIELV